MLLIESQFFSKGRYDSDQILFLIFLESTVFSWPLAKKCKMPTNFKIVLYKHWECGRYYRGGIFFCECNFQYFYDYFLQKKHVETILGSPLTCPYLGPPEYLLMIKFNKLFFWIKNRVYNTLTSKVVTHPSAIQAQRCVTLENRRDPVLSPWYGRRQKCTKLLNTY